MGLPMDDLHTPTVPSGPSTHHDDGNKLAGLSLVDLITRKANVEAELKALGSVLDSHGVNMNTSLTTFDGYPRDDLDIAQSITPVRTTRARIIRLKNDYKDVMKKIELGLHEYHASIQAVEEPNREPESSALPEQPLDRASEPLPESPFAKVNTVSLGSPAQEAGLKAGDAIRAFGSANWMNHENLNKVGEIVQRNEGRAILVKVVRGADPNAEELQLQLTPRRGWGGRGTLGCHILPV